MILRCDVVNLWFVGAFWQEEKESRADLMMRVFCFLSSWTNIFVTLLYLIFVKNLLLAEHVYFQQTALVSLLVINLFMHDSHTEDITNYC
jgi:hypothetical protein